MKLEKLVGERFKERPADCVIDSHAIMVKGGYIKYMANGIYSSYLPLRRIVRKIEQILREEMDKIDGQEVQFPVVMPASLWDESGRYDSIGDELLRFTDRNNAKMVLGMTHEEAAVHLVREYAQSYTKYPFMIYQIQTKFRDEARPRAGLIRVREFTMKDAYSFHTSQEDLEQYYEKCHAAYERIFERVGVPEVVSVKSDSGMMGGNISHEFMLLTPVGEDSIVLCDSCDYRANMEAAENISDIARDAESAALEKVYTPNVHTIEDVCNFFGDETKNSCKAVVYQQNVDDKYVVLFIRGDLEVNETKLVNFLGEQVHAAVITEECGLNAGYIGPVNLKVNGDAVVLYDKSLEGRNNLPAEPTRQSIITKDSTWSATFRMPSITICKNPGGRHLPEMRQKDREDLQRYRGRKYLPAWNQIYKIHEYDLCRCKWREQDPDHGMLRYRCRPSGSIGLRGTSR